MKLFFVLYSLFLSLNATAKSPLFSLSPNIDLAKKNLSRVNFKMAHLTDAELRGADLSWADLAGAIIDSKYRDMIMASKALNIALINWV